MGWGKSSGAKRTAYRLGAPPAATLREAPPGMGAGIGLASGGSGGPVDGSSTELPARPSEMANPTKRDRRALPVCDVATGQDLETPVNLDNTLLQAMFPDLRIALGQVPPPPARSSPEQLEVYYQTVIHDLARDLAGQEGMALDVATDARKEGRFLYTDGQVGRKVADTFEKVMAYGGLLASPCQHPPKLLEGLRVLVVRQGDMGTGDCAGKMSTRLARLFGKDGTQAGQFRLGVRLDEDTILVGKGTLKLMDRVDVDAEGRGYDLILPDSSFKGNVPAYDEHTWDCHLGFVAWSQERRTKLSYQALQWFTPEVVQQAIFPRADAQIPILLAAMATTEGACKYLRIERENLDAETRETLRGELAVEELREPAVLEEVLAAGTAGEMIDHPYVQAGLRRRLRQSWHDLAVDGGVRVPSFMGLPDSFRGNVDWLPDGCVVCPDLPPGEVLATRYPIRTRHDVQIWRNLDWEGAFRLTVLGGRIDPVTMRSFFKYAQQHKGVVFMSHATAAKVGGDFDGDNFQIMPVSRQYRPLAEIRNPNRDWSDLTPLVDQVRCEGWGQEVTTAKVKRRLATHIAPERPEDVTDRNRPWLASAAIQQGGHRQAFLADVGRHLDAQALDAESRQAAVQAFADAAQHPNQSLDAAVEVAQAHGFDAHAWITQREPDLFDLARAYNREQLARQALKNMDSDLGQIVYTISRVNASDRYAPEQRERLILRLAEELQAEVDKFKYDTAADMEFVDTVRKEVGRDLVWLDVHKDPDTFSRTTHLSPKPDAVSHLWNHVTGQFRAWERAPQPPRHFQGMLPAEYSAEQLVEARRRVRAYNRTIARAMQAEDEKALVSAIQEMESWSDSITDLQERRTWAQAVWHAAHDTDRPGATASAAFHAFRPETLEQLGRPQSRPMSEIVILGAQHRNNLGERTADYDRPRTVRLQVLLEDYQDTYGRPERRLAAYELGDDDRPVQRIGYLPKDAPRREGSYLATLQRPEGKRRIEGKLSPLQDYEGGEDA
jgi:hypothetical protein